MHSLEFSESIGAVGLAQPPDEAATNTAGAHTAASDFVLRFFANHDDESPLAPFLATEELIALYLKAAKEKSAHVAMVWPGSLSSVPLIHSLGCFKLWGEGYKRGVRGVFYPGKRNSFYPLNHVFISRSKLSELANKIYEPGSEQKNELIREGLRSKDSFLFACNSLRHELTEASLRPSVNELLPHFMREAPGQAWSSYADHFYARVKSKLSSRKQGKALGQCTFPELGAPQSAPDALFALGYRLSREELQIALKGFHKIGIPEVVLIDATRQMMKSVGGLKQRIVEFIAQIREVFKEQCPGILVLMDEPRQMSLLQAALMQAEGNSPRAGRLEQHGFVFTPIGFGLSAEGVEHELTIPACRVRTVVTDFEVGKLIDQFYHSAQRLESQGRNAMTIWDTIGFLARTSQIPGGSGDLMDELHRRDAPHRTVAAFDWLHHKAPLLEFLRSGEALEERSLLEKLLGKADKLIEAQRDHTPFGLRVEAELEAATKAGIEAAVVVRTSLHRNVLQAALQRNLDGNGALADNLILMTKQIVAQERPVEAERIIYADISAAVLRDIVNGQFAGNEMVLVLTAPMAAQLKHTINPLLKMAEFAVFHARLAAVLNDITEQFEAAGVSLLADIEIRQTTFQLATYDEVALNVPDSEAVLVALDNGLLLHRGLHSRVYTYDPLQAADGYSGFHAVQVEDLEAGQQVFVMSSELRELIEVALQDKGFSTGKHIQFEQGLRTYHERVQTQVNAIYRGNRAAQVRMLQDNIVRRDASLEPELNNIRHWLDLGHSLDTPFDKLAPQAPRKFKQFHAFCRELRFQEIEIQWFWDFVIRPLRGIRRKDGRWLSDIYTRIIFDPESAIAYMGLGKNTIDDLRRRALDNVFTVSEVVLPNIEE
jgi:hypothetical protein